ncbi:MAG TPA: YdcF family protein [Solirubrobacteraceae bacterium]|nr:YdcF family protein [Solirubrobacteraceae bacterium]
MNLPLRMLRSLALAVAAVALVTGGRIKAGGRSRTPRPGGAILVFGAAVGPGGPCTALGERLSHAADLYHAGLAPCIVCCGGQIEVEAMHGFLIARGIPEHAVILDPEASTTRRSVAGARRRGHGSRVIVVSSSYHVHRIMAECRRQRFDAEPWPVPPRTRESRSPFASLCLHGHLLREVVAVWWYSLTAWARP